MKHSKPYRHYGRWLPWTMGTLAFAGLAETLFALSEVLENDTDGDGWTDAEEIIAGTDPADATEPWDSDGDGGTEFAVTQDSGAAFTGSDWVLSRTRQANPVAFQSGSKLKLVPTFRLPDSTVPARIQAQVTLGNSTNTYTLAWSERGNGIEIPAPVPAGTVGYFENATIVWKVSYDANSDTWEDVGTSTHEIYFTRGAPLTPLRQETLFRISCKQAAGLSDPTAIVDAIYAEFTDLDVRRVSDGKRMTYWAWSEERSDYWGDASSATEILSNSSADGNCQAWDGLFRSMVKLHEIQAISTIVSSRFTIDKTLQSLNNSEWLLIKEWIFSEKAHPNFPLYVYQKDAPGETTIICYTHVKEVLPPDDSWGVVQVGATILGQGADEEHRTPPRFNAHWIVQVGDYYYDPSYGTPKISLKDYENSAIEGFHHPTTNYCRKNGAAVPDLVYMTNPSNNLE